MLTATVVLLALVLVRCSVALEPLSADLPVAGCVVKRDHGGLSYERVVIVAQYSEVEWLATYPDSSSRETFILRKDAVIARDCSTLYGGGERTVAPVERP